MSDSQNSTDWTNNYRETENFRPEVDFAQKLDERDPLKNYRHEFYIPKDTYYFNGNSLGLCSERAEQVLNQVKSDWKEMGIKGWMKAQPPWFWFSEELSKNYAPLVGAYPHEVTVTGSTTSNIHNLIATFYNPDYKSGKTKIIMEEPCFPTDIYAVKSQIQLRGLDPEKHLIIVPGNERGNIDQDALLKKLKQHKHELSLAFFSSVLFSSGQLLDLGIITEIARANNITVGFDLSHSIGVIPHNLHNLGVDFAVWCSYKWISAGPGATAAIFVHDKHLPLKPAFAGWWGHDKESQFEMNSDYTPASGAGAFQLGTIDMLSAAPIAGALDIINAADIEHIRQKSVLMTNYFIYLIDHYLEDFEIEIITPRESSQRGGHISVKHPEAHRVNKALEDRGVIGDFRGPNTIRLAPSPLYNTYEEIFQVVQFITTILHSQEYLQYSSKKESVT